MSDESFSTLSVHAGRDRHKHHGAASIPVYNASIFSFEDAETGAEIHNEQSHGYYYGRLGNPTTEAFEVAVARLEKGEAALAFASGMAAVSAAILSIVKAGDHIIAPASMYATVANLFRHLQNAFGVQVSFVDAREPDAYINAVRPNTKVFWIESPSNPLLNVVDMSYVANAARSAGVVTIADNTFATPFNQRPLELGIDIVVHSATKYLGGHSDLTAGAVVGSSETLKNIRGIATKLFGGTIAPQTAWLALRGIKTLALRMERHNSNAYALAHMLSAHKKVLSVRYPGLVADPSNKTAKEQMKGFGGMVAFELENRDAAIKFVNALRLVSIATSLGGVESVIQHSASMTHAAVTPNERLLAGITDGLLRFSVGIEDAGDLERDIRQALETV